MFWITLILSTCRVNAVSWLCAHDKEMNSWIDTQHTGSIINLCIFAIIALYEIIGTSQWTSSFAICCNGHRLSWRDVLILCRHENNMVKIVIINQINGMGLNLTGRHKKRNRGMINKKYYFIYQMHLLSAKYQTRYIQSFFYVHWRPFTIFKYDTYFDIMVPLKMTRGCACFKYNNEWKLLQIHKTFFLISQRSGHYTWRVRETTFRGISFRQWKQYSFFFSILSLMARFIGPTWGPSGADRTQVGPMFAAWTLLSGLCQKLDDDCALGMGNHLFGHLWHKSHYRLVTSSYSNTNYTTDLSPHIISNTKYITDWPRHLVSSTNYTTDWWRHLISNTNHTTHW